MDTFLTAGGVILLLLLFEVIHKKYIDSSPGGGAVEERLEIPNVSRNKNIKKRIAILTRNLQKLREKEASFGRLNTPVFILNEIEDTELAIEELREELTLERGGADEEYFDTRLEFSEDTGSKHWVQILIKGDFTSLTANRQTEVIESFAALVGVSPRSITIHRIYEGSLVFNLSIPLHAVHRLNFRLQSNSPQFRLLNIFKVKAEIESNKLAIWAFKDGKFDLVIDSSVEIGFIVPDAVDHNRIMAEPVITKAYPKTQKQDVIHLTKNDVVIVKRVPRDKAEQRMSA